MTGLLAMKFGGTSMGSTERIKAAAALVLEQHEHRPVAVVVSAMSKVTDLLLDTMKHAEARDEAGLRQNIDLVRGRHLRTARELEIDAAAAIEDLIAEFERIAGGMLLLGDRPLRSIDEAVAVGERLSAVLLSCYLNKLGFAAEAINDAEVLVTDAVFGNASPLMDLTAAKAALRLKPLLEARIIPVITGFNGATADGRCTTLGRGGSDFSASILAAALDAAELWIWTDVDGIMTADPQLVPEARILDELSFAEAAELAYNGAKVLHPRTLAPLVEKRIPVWSKNSFAPEKPGTRIVSELTAARGARAVTSMPNVALLSLEPAQGGLSGVHVLARAMDAVARSECGSAFDLRLQLPAKLLLPGAGG